MMTTSTIATMSRAERTFQKSPKYPARVDPWEADQPQLRMVAVLIAVSLVLLLLVKLKPAAEVPLPVEGVAHPLPAAAAQTAAARPALSPVFAPEVQRWSEQIIDWALTYGLDPNMVATVMQIESCGDPNALSGAGAMGLFQVMPYHFQPGENSYDPDTNAMRGMLYLKERLAQTGGNVGQAFAGYNGGHVAAGSGWDQWAHETQRYFIWATGIYADAQAGLSESPTLNEWLAAGGNSLCVQARG